MSTCVEYLFFYQIHQRKYYKVTNEQITFRYL